MLNIELVSLYHGKCTSVPTHVLWQSLLVRVFSYMQAVTIA